VLLLVLVCGVGGYFGWQHRDEVKEKLPFLKAKADYNDNYGEDAVEKAFNEELDGTASKADESKFEFDDMDDIDDMTDDDADMSVDDGAKTSQAVIQAQSAEPAKAKVAGLMLFSSLFRGSKKDDANTSAKLAKDLEDPDALRDASKHASEASSRSFFFADPDEKAAKFELHTDGESDSELQPKARQAVAKKAAVSPSQLRDESESEDESVDYNDYNNAPPANFSQVKGRKTASQTKNSNNGKQSSQDDEESYSNESDYSSRSGSSRSSRSSRSSGSGSSYYSESESSSESDADQKKSRSNRR